jgi:CheY-like chemotaxis protein
MQPVLIIDESTDESDSILRSLSRLRIANPVLVFFKSPDAIQYLESSFNLNASLPSVILLDLKLAERDGFQFLSWKNSQFEMGSILTIGVSGVAAWVSIQRARSLGVGAFIAKPVRQSALEILIDRFPEPWMRPTIITAPTISV